jgi:hypothetical protein
MMKRGMLSVVGLCAVATALGCSAEAGDGEEEKTETQSSALGTSFQAEWTAAQWGNQTNGNYYGRDVRAFWSNGEALANVYVSAGWHNVAVTFYSTACWSGPGLTLNTESSGSYRDTMPNAWRTYNVSLHFPRSGWNTLRIGMANDQWQPGVCDANMFVDNVVIY